MKTLNKTLSLVLVLVMVFSLFGVASAATKMDNFTDKGDVTYKEAVDYLTAAGVVAGDTATTINPKGDFTREQAAKLVAYACLGQIAADAMVAPAAPFTDVAADRWSAGYIAYCAKQGIINGMGDGNFAPTAKVTGTQLGKMLLCAIGFGINGEYTGAGWELAVAKDSLGYGIFEGNTAGANNTNGASREEAFLYTYNTLSTLCNVSYNKALGVYYVPGQTAMNTNPKSVNIGTAFDTREDTVGYQRFKMLKTVADGTYDEAAHNWAIDGKKVTGVYPDDAIVKLASVAAGTPYTNLTTKGDTAYIGYAADTTVSYYVNGDKSTKAAVENSSNYKGNFINFLDTDKDGKYDTVEALNYTVVKLDAAPVITTSGDVKVVTIAEMNMSKVTDDNITGNFADLKKDDYVLYYSNAKKTDWTVAKCETITGQMFGFNKNAGKFNINGKEYGYSQIANLETDYDEISEVKGLAGTVFYLDAAGYVCAAEPTEDIVAAANVVFVAAAADNGLGTVSAKMLKSDASVITKTINKVTSVSGTSSAAVCAGMTGTVNVTPVTFYTFTENTDGSYNLKAIYAVGDAGAAGNAAQSGDAAYTTAGNAIFKKGASTFFYKAGNVGQTVMGTNKTVFVLEGDTATTVGSYKAYTGVSAIPNVNAFAAGSSAYVLQDKDGYAVMAVALGCDLDTTTTSLDYAFVGFTPSTVSMTKNASEDYYNYPIATINGEIKAFDATINTVNPGLAVIDGYDGAKVDSVLGFNPLADADSDGIADYFDDTRVERAIFNLLSPGKYTNTNTTLQTIINNNDKQNVTAYGFDVVGNTVSFTDINGVGYVGAAQSFVVSDDVKVFYHDCREMNSTGKITIEKQSGINILESLPATSTNDPHMYGVSALSISKDNSTINELYITLYPATSGSKLPNVNADKVVTSIAADKASLIVDNKTEIVLAGNALKYVTKGAVEEGDTISYTLADTGKMTNITAIKPEDGAVDFANGEAIASLAVDGNLNITHGTYGVAAAPVEDVVVTGNLVISGDADVYAKNWTVGGTTTKSSTGTVSFNSDLRGKVTVSGTGATSFTNVEFGAGLEVTDGTATVTVTTSTVTGTVKGTATTTVKNTTVSGNVEGAVVLQDTVSVTGTVDPAADLDGLDAASETKIKAAQAQAKVNAAEAAVAAYEAGLVNVNAALKTNLVSGSVNKAALDDAIIAADNNTKKTAAESAIAKLPPDGDSVTTKADFTERVTAVGTAITKAKAVQTAVGKLKDLDITAGSATGTTKFSAASDALEYRVGNTGAFAAVPAEEFAVNIGDVITVRIKAATASVKTITVEAADIKAAAAPAVTLATEGLDQITAGNVKITGTLTGLEYLVDTSAVTGATEGTWVAVPANGEVTAANTKHVGVRVKATAKQPASAITDLTVAGTNIGTK